MPTRDLIVIGSSMGGIEALRSLAAQLPADLPAAVFVVQHVAAASPGTLSTILDTAGPMPAVTAEDGMALEIGRIHVAVPDRHLMLGADGIRVVYGPRENHSRPAIDVLFRTAAVHHGSRVIGVVLTGLLNDGAAGLLAIKRCGGLAVVQAPDDAAYPEMPRSALAAVEADHQPPLAELGALLARCAGETAPPSPAVPSALALEVRLTGPPTERADWTELPGENTNYTCPGCGGVLRDIGSGHLRRYRCHVGHAYTAHTLLDDQHDSVEEALWVAVRTLEERTSLLGRMAQDERTSGRSQSAVGYEERASESRHHADQVRALLHHVH